MLQQQQHFPAWIKDVHPARLDKQRDRQTNVHPIMLDKPTICIRTKTENREQSLKKTLQELRMLSPSLFIQGSQCKCWYCCSQLSDVWSVSEVSSLRSQVPRIALKFSDNFPCLKGHMYLRVLYDSVLQQCNAMAVSEWVSESVSDEGTYRAVWGQLNTSEAEFNEESLLLLWFTFSSPHVSCTMQSWITIRTSIKLFQPPFHITWQSCSLA